MRRAKKCVSPGVEALEAKELLSTAGPVLTTIALSRVAGQIKPIVSRLARTQDTTQAGAALARLASRTPLGATQLAPVWQFDLVLYAEGKGTPGVTLGKRLTSDLYRDVLRGVSHGQFRVVGPGSTVFQALYPPPGTPMYAEDSVNFYNETGMSLTIKCILNPTGFSPVPKTMSVGTGGPTYFNFGTSTGDTIELATINGMNFLYDLPFPTFPPNGYYGASFTITMLGSSFNITAGAPS